MLFTPLSPVTATKVTRAEYFRLSSWLRNAYAMPELHPGRRGRPRVYCDVQEGRRARASRPGDSQITGEQFQHTFLYYDPRIIPGESTWHAESRSQFDEIGDALNAVPLSHEGGVIDTSSPDDSNLSLQQEGSLSDNETRRPARSSQPPSNSIADAVPVRDSHSLPSEGHRSESPGRSSLVSPLVRSIAYRPFL